MAKPTGAPHGRWQLFDGFNDSPFDALVPRQHELGNAFAVFDGERGLAVVDQDDAHVSAVIRVDGARAVEDGHAVL